MSTVPRTPNTTAFAAQLVGRSGTKAAKTAFSADAVQAIDADRDGKLTHAEMKAALDRLDVASQVQIADAAVAYHRAAYGGLGRKALVGGTILAACGMFLGRVGGPLSYVAAALTLVAACAGQFWDHARRKAAQPALFRVVNPALERLK